MRSPAAFLRDLWRGYSDADVRSLNAKLEAAKARPPGSLMRLTVGEHRAFRETLP